MYSQSSVSSREDKIAAASAGLTKADRSPSPGSRLDLSGGFHYGGACEGAGVAGGKSRATLTALFVELASFSY